jgi:hypothetical protein
LGLRNNVGISLGTSYQEFLGFKDKLHSIELNVPRNDPYRQWGLDYATGNLAGRNYTSVGPSFKYRPYNNFQVSASYQSVRHFTNSSQTILSGSYELNAYDSIVGRVIQSDRDTNGYLAYRRTGNTGNEYFLILGDPNAKKFRPSIVLKAVFPMNLKF